MKSKRLVFSLIMVLMHLGLGLGLPKIQADFSYRGYYVESHPLVQEFDRFKQEFGDDSKLALIIETPQGVFNPEIAKIIKSLTEKMWLLPEIIRVDSLSNFTFVEAHEDDILIDPFLEDVDLSLGEFLEKKNKALKDRDLPNYLISTDGKSTMIVATFKPRFDKVLNNEKTILGLRSLIEESQTKDVVFYIAGNAAVTHAFKEVSRRDLKVISPILAIALLLFLWISFKTIFGLVAPILVIFSTISMTFGLAGFLGIKYSNIIGAVPIILVAISLADCIHLLSGYYRKRKWNEFSTSLNYSLKKNLVPTLLTTLTTAVGFFSLASSDLLPISGLGVLGGSGAILAWINTYFWIMILSPMFQNESSSQKDQAMEQLLTKIFHTVKNFPRLVIATCILSFVISSYFSSKNEANADPLIYLSENIPFRKATMFMDEKIGGASGVEIIIDSERENGLLDVNYAKKVDQFVLWLKDREKYSKVLSYTEILKRLNQAFKGDDPDEYRLADSREALAQQLLFYSMGLTEGKSLNDQMTSDYRKARITGLWTLHDSKTILSEFDFIEKKIQSLGLKGHVSGKMPIYHSMNDNILKTFATSTLSALAGIILILILLFRSFKVGLVSIIPNIFPLAYGGMILFFLGKPIDIGTVLIGAICLGIAVDDTIHFLSSFYFEIRSGKDSKAAVQEVLYSVGPALIKTTATLIVGFSSFMLADFVPNFNLGLGICIILFIALIMDLFVLPAFLILFKFEK